MPVPSKIQLLIERLTQELDHIEQAANKGLNILRRVMSRFPENVVLVQYFAYLNTILVFVETTRNQIQTIFGNISSENVPAEIIQESGEDLGTLLGRVLETKARLRQISNFLEELP